MDICYDDIVKYADGLKISKDKIDACIQKVSEIQNVTKEEICHEIKEYISSIVDETLKTAAKSGMALKDYQRKTLEYMFHNRGLVIAFDVGAGKTLTAASITHALIKQASVFGKSIKVYIVTPTSLQENFKKEMRAAKFPITKNYEFFTIAGFANAYTRGEVNCSESLLIIDEAHNLRKDYRSIFGQIKFGNKDANKARISKFLKCAQKAWKVVLLTATPTYNKIYDVVNLAALVLRKDPPLTDTGFKQLINNPDKFREYFGCMFAFLRPPRDQFPRRQEKMDYIVMTDKYYKAYMDVENGLKKNEKGEEAKNAFMVRVRAAANNLQPCLKCKRIAEIVKTGEKTLIYSFFKGSGIEIVQDMLTKEGIKFDTITGSITKKERTRIVKDFNSEKMTVLFITKAGGEGLDLKGVRNIILMEKGWNIASEEQVIGRGIRFRSHAHLPPEQRYVVVHHLVLIKPSDKPILNMSHENALKAIHDSKKEKVSADLYLHISGLEKQRNLDEFNAKLDDISLFKNEDCMT